MFKVLKGDSVRVGHGGEGEGEGGKGFSKVKTLLGWIQLYFSSFFLKTWNCISVDTLRFTISFFFFFL